jgi:hypothetical protein
MFGTSTLVNVAAGSGLKIIGYIAGRVVDGFFRTQEMAIANKDADTARMVQLNSGDDTASDFTRVTRRLIAWSFTFAACFILVWFALNGDQTVAILTDKDKGIFGWIVGGANQTVVQVSKAQMIMNMWPLLELMFGFYFTRVGKGS